VWTGLADHSRSQPLSAAVPKALSLPQRRKRAHAVSCVRHPIFAFEMVKLLSQFAYALSSEPGIGVIDAEYSLILTLMCSLQYVHLPMIAGSIGGQCYLLEDCRPSSAFKSSCNLFKICPLAFALVCNALQVPGYSMDCIPPRQLGWTWREYIALSVDARGSYVLPDLLVLSHTTNFPNPVSASQGGRDSCTVRT
jgi:hypothetical protein